MSAEVEEKEYEVEKDGELPTWEQSETLFKEHAVRRVRALNSEFRTRTFGTGELRGASKPLPPGTVIADHYFVVKEYKTDKKHRSNSFVYLCGCSGWLVAVKIGRHNLYVADRTFNSVFREFLVWRELYKFAPFRFLNPPIVDPMLDARSLSFFALSFSLQDLMNKYRVLPFSLCLLAAMDSLCALKQLHDVGFVHCQVSPRHLCFGLEAGDTESGRVHLIDLSHATRYVQYASDSLIPYVEITTPDPVYDTSDVLDGKPHTRRDDLLSWMYTILAFRRCHLWRNLDRKRADKVKNELGVDRLVAGYHQLVGPALAVIFEYLRSLAPHAKPDYSFIMKCLVSAYRAFCPSGLPTSLTVNAECFWSMDSVRHDLLDSKVIEVELGYAKVRPVFNYVDEYPNVVRSHSVQPLIDEYFEIMNTTEHGRMFNKIDDIEAVTKKYKWTPFLHGVPQELKEAAFKFNAKTKQVAEKKKSPAADKADKGEKESKDEN